MTNTTVFESNNESFFPCPGMTADEKCRFVSVISPVGGSGKTTVALALSEALALNGYKTLFVGLDLLETCAFDVPLNSKTLSDLLFSLKTGMENINDRFDLSVCEIRENFCFMNCVIPPEDLLSVTATDVSDVFDIIRSKEQFDFCVLDLPFGTSEVHKKTVNLSDLLLVPFRPERESTVKAQNGIKILEKFKSPETGLISVLNMVSENGGPNKDTDIVIPKYESLNRKQIINEIIRSRMFRIKPKEQ